MALWEIIAEVLHLVKQPSNPFQVDMAYLDHLPLEEGILLTGALVNFLQTIWLQMQPTVPYADAGKVPQRMTNAKVTMLVVRSL